MQHFGDVGRGDLHAASKIGLVETKLLHPAKNPTKKCRSYVIKGGHWREVKRKSEKGKSAEVIIFHKKEAADAPISDLQLPYPVA